MTTVHAVRVQVDDIILLEQEPGQPHEAKVTAVKIFDDGHLVAIDAVPRKDVRGATEWSDMDTRQVIRRRLEDVEVITRPRGEFTQPRP